MGPGILHVAKVRERGGGERNGEGFPLTGDSIGQLRIQDGGSLITSKMATMKEKETTGAVGNETSSPVPLIV